MNWPELANNVNDALKRAVQVHARYGSNRSGSIAAVADYLGVSPQIVKMRINDEIVGEPRSKGLLAARCWEFLAMVAQRERARAESLALEVEQARLRLQLNLPLTGQANAQSVDDTAARRVALQESDLATARRSLAEFEQIKRRS